MATSAKRRVQQALGLAQQLTAVRTDNRELVSQLAQAQAVSKRFLLIPLQYWLCTPEIQWRSRCKDRIPYRGVNGKRSA
jgi:hypothetical protein